MSVLDDLKMIHERDQQDALGVAEHQWEQLTHAYSIAPVTLDIENVVYAGMGGSSLSALLFQTWPGSDVPFEVCRSYDIPAYVGPKTLFIAASFSGNTEETLSALAQAEAKGAIIVVIASGGKLADIAETKQYPFARLPVISQPRYGALYVLRATCEIMAAYGVISQDRVAELEQYAPKLEATLKTFAPTVLTEENPAKLLALELMGSSPVVYASSKFFSVAYKWKISFNENAKNVAWCNAYPEFNHNEFLGWTSHPVDKPYKVIDLRSSFDHPQITKRFEVSDRMLSGQRPAAQVVQLQGENSMEQMIYGMVFGDFVSLYLALLNGINPTPVDIITKLKQALV
jgi:glucose/mannose-6-phosphate isomerase